MLVYIEYISRRPHVPLADFRTIAVHSQAAWAGSYARDRLLLNLGRTWRIGPDPEYLAVWYTPEIGIERLGEWEATFASGEADNFEKPMELAARLDRAGCYDPLVEPTAAEEGRFYAEFFDFRPDADRSTVTAYFTDRQDRSGLQLPLLVDRIGFLGPDPRGVAVWKLRGYADLETVGRDVCDEDNAPIRLITAGLYAPVGEEIL